MTDMLAELESLEPKIAAAKQSLAFGAAADKARTPLQQAPRHAALLGRMLAFAEDLEALDDAPLRQRLTVAIEKAEDVGAALEEAQSADALEAAALDYPQVSGALGRVVDALRARWSLIVAQDFADLIAVGELLGKISGAESIGKELALIGQQAKALADAEAAAEHLAERATQLRARRASALDAMRAFTGEAEVDAFLAAVTRQQASLAMVTLKVLDWLRTKDALEAFRVRG